MRAPAALAFLLLPLLAGCTGPPQAGIGCSERGEAPPEQPLPRAESLTFSTGDGVALRGSLWPGATPRWVVMVHGLNEDRHSWGPLVDRLWHKGWTVLTFDLRGHGESRARGGQPYELRNFTGQDFASMEQDVGAAVSLVRGRGEPSGTAPRCLVLVGASLGANLALRSAAADKEAVKAAALLSPGEDYRGVRTDDAIAKVPDEPLFLAAARGDPYAAEAAQRLADVARRDTLALVDGDAHGTELLRVPDFQPRLVAWFQALG